MPNKKSAAKRVRQNERRRAHNRAQRSEMRTFIKKVRQAAESGEVDSAQQLLVTAQARIDKAAKVNLIKKGNASRKISRLSQAISRAKAQQSGASEA